MYGIIKLKGGEGHVRPPRRDAGARSDGRPSGVLGRHRMQFELREVVLLRNYGIDAALPGMMCVSLGSTFHQPGGDTFNMVTDGKAMPLQASQYWRGMLDSRFCAALARA